VLGSFLFEDLFDLQRGASYETREAATTSAVRRLRLLNFFTSEATDCIQFAQRLFRNANTSVRVKPTAKLFE